MFPQPSTSAAHVFEVYRKTRPELGGRCDGRTNEVRIVHVWAVSRWMTKAAKSIKFFLAKYALYLGLLVVYNGSYLKFFSLIKDGCVGFFVTIV